MYGMDLHFEVALDRSGSIRIYFSDGQRVDLPASSASNVALKIQRPGNQSEPVTMVIDATGEYWQGRSAPIKQGDATLNFAFVFHGNPLVVSVPASVFLPDGKTAGRGR